jgi:predicted NBD/HSP70 family sugar kinase
VAFGSDDGHQGRAALIRGLDALFEEAPISRRQLRTALGSSPSTVTEVVHELLDRGLVIESGTTAATGGRPAKVLDLAPALGVVLAADIGAMNMRFGAGSVKGQLLARNIVPTPSIGDPQVLHETLVTGLEHVHQQVGGGEIRALVLGVAAIVNPADGGISMATVPGWPHTESKELHAWLREGLSDYPLVLENEANLAAIGEHRHGSARGANDVMFVAVGAGIGSGLILNGVLFRGSRGASGEIGLVRLMRGRKPFELDRLAGAGALVARYREAGGSEHSQSAESVFERAAAGDSTAKRVIEEVMDDLALAIANAITMVNPERVVIGGGLAAAGHAFIEPLTARVRELVDTMPDFASSQLGPDAALVGGLSLASEHARKSILDNLTRNPVDPPATSAVRQAPGALVI